MTTVTLVLTDLFGKGVAVQTTARTPCAGKSCTLAEALAMDLLRLCAHQATRIEYESDVLSSTTKLLRDLLDPEELGHAVTPEVRERVRICLGMGSAQSHLAGASQS